MTMKASILCFLRGETGAGAAEFAMVLPLFFTLVFGIVNFSIVAYAEAAMHKAAEAAARCASIGVTCTSADTTQSYARSSYHGPSVSATFAYTTPTSGSCSGMKQVYATGTYRINLVLGSWPISLHARSCYP